MTSGSSMLPRSLTDADILVRAAQELALADAAAKHFVEDGHLATVTEVTTVVSPKNDGYVRMCPWTKRFHHNGEWLSLNAFFKTRFGLTVTHGISEDALDCVLKDIDKVN